MVAVISAGDEKGVKVRSRLQHVELVVHLEALHAMGDRMIGVADRDCEIERGAVGFEAAAEEFSEGVILDSGVGGMEREQAAAGADEFRQRFNRGVTED